MSDPKKEMTPEAKEAYMRLLLFRPCKTKKELYNWIKLFLGWDTPDCIVDPDSNSSPMDMIWEVYSKALSNDDPDFSRVLYFSARDAYKTTSAAILEVLAVLHLGRDVAHMAAQEQQSQKSQQYVKKHFSRPVLRDYLVGDNKQIMWIVRYHNSKTGANIPEAQFKELSAADAVHYEEIRRYIRIIIATRGGANSEHVGFFCVDGETRIMAEVTNPTQRLRKAQTARGIFRKLEGKNPGGRTGGEIPLTITAPADCIKLLSLNLETGTWEFQPIVRAQRSKRTTIIIETESGRRLACTSDHPLMTPGKGFVQSGNLSVGDALLRVNRSKSDQSGVESTLSPEPRLPGIYSEPKGRWHQVLLGSLLGDCGIYKKPKNNAYLSEQHCVEQADYLAWKVSIISEKLRTVPLKSARSGYTGKEQIGFRSGCTPLLNDYVAVRTDLAMIDTLDPLGLAVWYMDDGCSGNRFRLSTECFTERQNELLVALLKKNFGIETAVQKYSRDDKTYYCIQGGIDAKRRLSELCAPHIHPTMAYKFETLRNRKLCKFCSKEFWPYEADSLSSVTCGSVVCKLLQRETLDTDVITKISDGGERWVYDFTLPTNHNYVSNGLISHNCVDEVDLVADPEAYSEAKMIPAPINGKMPITVLTSTRKYSFGLVQKEIDAQLDDEGNQLLQIRHWNIIDVTQSCPPSRHLPDEPKIPIYVYDNALKAISETKYEALQAEEKQKYEKHEGYAGCLSQCKLFSACKGTLATRQTSTSPLLKPIDHTINQFFKSNISIETALAQLLCRKPSTEGLIYPNFERSVHMLTATQMAEKISGEPQKQGMTKPELIAFMKARDMRFGTGVDFGYTHLFAAVTGAIDGYRAFIFDVIAAAHLETSQQIEALESIRHLSPSLYPDTAYPGSLASLKKAGFRVVDWKKTPGSVVDGINIIRTMMMPPLGAEPRLYLLAGDPQCELLAKHLSQYHWKLDAAGEPTDTPDEKDDDILDALRYFLMNLFSVARGRVQVATSNQTGGGEPYEDQPGVYTRENWAKKILEEATQGGDPGNGGLEGKKGSVKWSF